MIGFAKPVTPGACAVVTGAGSGIGRAFAVKLAARGASVVCADINEVSVRETVALVEQAGATGIAVTCDVSRSDDVVALRDRAVDWFGHAPTLLINNAGIGAGGNTVGRASLEDWHRTLQINLWGVIYGCHHFLPIMKQAGRGGVINVASAAGFAAGPRMAAYNVSKAGVMSLSETLAAELSGTGVRVTVLCPTFVKTGIFSGELIEPQVGSTGAQIANWVGMSPEKVAAMALDGHDHGELYVVPQLDARAIWLAKRLLPTTHARVAGLFGRLVPFTSEEEEQR
jgi:NAD(P)-dependent dehydrogenase (short-subunit alcohol dehydrogenase family)